MELFGKKGTMNFTSLELSKKLVALGCVSQSKYVWIDSDIEFPISIFAVMAFNYQEDATFTPAFCLEDFVGTHEQAKENAKKVFEDPWSTQRYEMIDSNDWRDYLEKAVEGR